MFKILNSRSSCWLKGIKDRTSYANNLYALTCKKINYQVNSTKLKPAEISVKNSMEWTFMKIKALVLFGLLGFMAYQPLRVI